MATEQEVKSFEDYLGRNYFTYEGAAIRTELPLILAEYRGLPDNDQLFNHLKNSGFIEVRDRSDRPWSKFLEDLLWSAFPDQNRGNFLGRGTIKLGNNFQPEQLNRLMTTNPRDEGIQM